VASPRFLEVADDRLAIEVAGTAEAERLATRLRQLPGCLESVGGIRVVEVQIDLATTDVDRFRPLAEACLFAPDEIDEAPAAEHRIAIRYGGCDGPDLEAVCARLGIGADEFIRQHSTAVYTVAMLGFTPGFAYLDGMPRDLSVPRRESPRPRLPAGSVGIAGGRTGIYALDGPGGWQIVGRTAHTLFDRDAVEPFLLAPGDGVRFEAE
jgi:KipI family sensor histidine kinase inhibitor